MAELISTRYAEALFEIAIEKDKVSEFYEDVKFIYETLENNSELFAVLKHPQISGEEKLNVLTTVFGGKAADDIIGLFSVVFRKNREAQLIEILGSFIEKVKDYQGIVDAEVISAKPLSQSQLERLKDKLSQTTGKQVDIKYSLDPSLIGGLQVKLCGRLIDNTVKRQINELKTQLNAAKI